MFCGIVCRLACVLDRAASRQVGRWCDDVSLWFNAPLFIRRL